MLFDSIELLAHYPFLGKTSTIEKVRLKVVRNYYIVYEVGEYEIHIHAIRDTRQNPVKLEKILKTLS